MKAVNRTKRIGLSSGAEYGEQKKGRGTTTQRKTKEAIKAPQLLKATAA